MDAMPEKILFYDPSENAEATLSVIRSLGYEVRSVNAPDELYSEIAANPYDLMLTEIQSDYFSETNGLFSFFEKLRIILPNQVLPHMAVTNTRNVFDISLAETYKVRPIFLKPVSEEVLRKAIQYRIMNKKKGLVLCPSANATYMQNCFAAMGFEVQCVSKLIEFSRVLHENRFDFFIFQEGFEGLPSAQLLNKILTVYTVRVPICFFLKAEDRILSKLLEKYQFFSIQVPPWDFSLCEEQIQDMVIKAYYKAPRKIFAASTSEKKEEEPVPVPEKKEEAVETMIPLKSPVISKLDETETGALSVTGFIRTFPMDLPVPKISSPLTQFLKTGLGLQKNKVAEVLKTSEGFPYLKVFIEAYKNGNDSLRESIVELFVEIPGKAPVMECLVLALNDRVPSIQHLALSGLRNYDLKKTLPYIRSKLRSPISKIKNSAAELLQNVKDPSLYGDFLSGVLNTEDLTLIKYFLFYVRNSFQEIKDFSIFLPVFKSSNYVLMEHLLELLIQTKDKKLLPLIRLAAGSGERVLLRLSLEGFRQIPDPSSVELLVDLVSGKEGAAAESAIMEIMHQFASAKYLSMFFLIVQKCQDSIKEEVLLIAKQFKEKESFPIFQAALRYGGTGTKIAAIESMSKWKKEHVILLIGPLLEDSDKFISEFVYKYIEENSTVDCIDSLLKVFISLKTDNAKEVIAHALARIVKDSDSSTSFLKVMQKDSYSVMVRILKNSGVSLGKFTSEVLGKHFTQGASFEIILRTLYDKNIEASAEAAFLLGEHNNLQAVPHLMRFIDDQNWYMRRMVVEALGKLKAVDTAHVLIKKLKDSHPSVRQAAATSLSQFNVKFKEPILVLFLEEESIKVLEQMLNLLSPFRDQKTADVYIPKLSAASVLTRINAAASLLSLWGDVDRKMIEGWLKSEKWAIRLLAFSFFSKEEPSVVMDSMDIFIMDKAEEVRRFLISFIAMQKKDECVQTLRSFIRDESPLVRQQVAMELVKMPVLGIREVLVEIAQFEINEEVLNSVLDYIYEHKDPEIFQILSEREEVCAEGILKRLTYIAESYERRKG